LLAEHLDNESNMTRREIATLACKILALWMFAQAAFFIAGVILMAIISVAAIFTNRGFRWDELVGAAVTGVPALGMLVIGLYFWFRAGRLADRMVSDDETPVTRPDITQADVMAVAFSAVGVFTLVPVFRDLAASFIRIAEDEYRFSEYWASANWQARFWSSIIGLAFALWLIFGSRGIVRVVLWARGVAAKRGGEPAAS
jgi:hypothetical protein